MKRSDLKVDSVNAVESFLDLFVYAEQKWYTWDKLEEAIAQVDYDIMTATELEWYIEFLANACFRVWRSSKEDTESNRVKEDDACFFIHNYNWNAYKFAAQKGTDQETTTKNVLCIDKEKLTEKEIKWLRSKIK